MRQLYTEPKLLKDQGKLPLQLRKGRRRSTVASRLSPVAIETMGAVGPKSMALLRDVGRRIAEETGELHARDFLFQRLSVAVQRGKCASVLGTITT